MKISYQTLTVAVVALLGVSGFAQDKKEDDFKAYFNTIEINRISPASIEAMKKAKKLNKSVTTGKEITQEDLAKLCTANPWITDFEIDNSNEHIHSFEPVAALTRLKRFEANSIKQAGENPISLKPLAALKELEEVKFYATPIADPDVLGGLPKLRVVNFYMANTPSIEFLRKTPEVTEVELYGSRHTFKNYEPLLALPKLERLGIYMNKQATDENVAVLSGIKTLKEISMSNSRQLTNLNFLSGSRDTMEKVRALWCTKLTDWSVLAEMPNLREVAIKDAPIKNLNFLKGKENIERLNLEGVKIDDLALITDLPNLKNIKVSEELAPVGVAAKIKSVLPNAYVSVRKKRR